MDNKLIINFEEYTKIVEKLAIQIHQNYKPTVLVGIMRGVANNRYPIENFKIANSIYSNPELFR